MKQKKAEQNTTDKKQSVLSPKVVLSETWKIFRQYWSALILAGGIYVVANLLGNELLSFYQNNYPDLVFIFSILIYLVLILLNVGLIKYLSDWVKISYDAEGKFLINDEKKTEEKKSNQKNKSAATALEAKAKKATIILESKKEDGKQPKLNELWRNWNLLIPFLFVNLGTNFLGLISALPFGLIAISSLFKAAAISWQEIMPEIIGGNWEMIGQLLMPTNWSSGQIFLLILAIVMLVVAAAVYFYVWSRYYLASYNVILSAKSGRYLANFGETSSLISGYQWQLAILYLVLTLMNIAVSILTMGLGAILTLPFMGLAYVVFYQKLVWMKQED